MNQPIGTSRRGFFGQAVVGVAAAMMMGTAGEAQIVWKENQWKQPEFNTLLNLKRTVKLVIDCAVIEDGEVLGAARNALNAMHYGFGVAKNEIQVIAALHGPANLLNYDDYIWQKYKVGEWFKLDDPETGKPATRNIFYPSKASGTAGAGLHYTSQDENNPDSAEQDTSIEGLRARGVRFLSCHFATEAQARVILKRFSLKQEPEEIVSEMLAHTVPGALVVPGVVGSVTMLQSVGHYSYLKIA